MTVDRNRHPSWRQIFQPEHPYESGLKLLPYLHYPVQAAANSRDEHLNQHPLFILPGAARWTNAKWRDGSQRVCQTCCSHGASQIVSCQSWALANCAFFKQDTALELNMQRRCFVCIKHWFFFGFFFFWPAQSLCLLPVLNMWKENGYLRYFSGNLAVTGFSMVNTIVIPEDALYDQC